MKVMLGGLGKETQLAEGITSVLRQLGHTPLKLIKDPIQGCNVLVAFVDDFTPELQVGVEAAIEADKPVLCLTDGRLPVKSPFLEAAGQAGHINLAHYRNLEDAADKLLRYMVFTAKRGWPSTLH